MFYCHDCAQHHEYPETMSKSQGNCEICGRTRLCNDRTSSSLPLPPAGVEAPPWKIDWVQRPYILSPADGEMYQVIGQLRDDRPLRVTVERRREDIRGERAPTVNWSAHGAVEPSHAWAYLEMLQLATRVATVGGTVLEQLLEQHLPPTEIPDPKFEEGARVEHTEESTGIVSKGKVVEVLRRGTPEGDPLQHRYRVERDAKGPYKTVSYDEAELQAEAS